MLYDFHMLAHWLISKEICMVHNGTHRTPAPAGAIALKRDIAVVDIPFAAPLWFCDCRFSKASYLTSEAIENIKFTNWFDTYHSTILQNTSAC